MTQECQTQVPSDSQETTSCAGDTGARADEKNAAAAVLRRGHAEYIRRRGLMLDCTPSDEWLRALINAAELLEGKQ